MNTISKDTAFAVLYLCGCVLSEKIPDVARLSEIDLKELYAVSRFHSLTALVCEGLELTKLSPTEESQKYITVFQKEKEKAARKNLMLDTKRSELFAFMEQNAIWYMPLKGVILKDMYPKIGLRQMADNDILFDKSYRKTIRDWFAKQGYEIKSYDIGNHDVYLKEPVYNYEMHIALFEESRSRKLQEYYKNVKSRLVKDSDNNYGYHFTDEDFYIYFISHGFKHFDGSGNGLRFLCDLYVYLKAKESTMDFSYINKSLKALELIDFEQNCRELVGEIFGDIHTFKFESLAPRHYEMLQYFLSSGAYGTLKQSVQKGVDKRGKLQYLFWRLFPGAEILKNYHPVFKNKWLMPIGWIYRTFKIISSREKKLEKAIREFKTIFKTKRK